MRLALRELVRQPGRFVTATAILTLIAILLMFLGGLLDGLIRNSTGAVRAQSGDAIVYSETSRSSFLRSRIEPGQRAAIAQADGIDEVGGLGVVLLGAGALAATPQASPTGPQPQVAGQGGIDQADSVMECWLKKQLGLPCDLDPDDPE